MAAKTRRIGNVVAFTPVGFLTGVGQLADVWGNSSADVHPPRIRRATKGLRERSDVSTAGSAKAALAEDVRKVGSDIYRSITRYATSGGKGV